MIDWNDREQYGTDNGISLARLPLLLLLPLPAAVLVAWLMKTAFFANWYILFLVPAAGGLVLGGVLYLAVGLSHCRNPWLAAVVGLFTGLVAFLGYYHF